MEQVKSFKEVGQVGTHAPQGSDLTGVAQKDYVGNLKHQLCLLSPKNKDYYLVHTLNEKSASSSIVFTHTCNDTHRLALMLGNLGIRAKPISGQMIQEERLDALNIFNSGECNILVCSDVGSRGLDIPFVDTVINYTIPPNPKKDKNGTILVFIRMNEMFAHILGKDLIGVAQTGYLDKLEHQLCFVPARTAIDLVHILNEISTTSSMVFTHPCKDAQRVSLMLGNLGVRAIPISGLDIPSVDTVINYTIPPIAEDYIHWVERTGFSILLVNQYEIEPYRDRQHIGKRVFSCYAHREEATTLAERVKEANQLALKVSTSFKLPNTTNSRTAGPDKGHAPDISKTHVSIFKAAPAALPRKNTDRGTALASANTITRGPLSDKGPTPATNSHK
ncbi:DEAD-box ATP-dependent RNA helicase 10-like protein [Tanacetum coccineum]